MAVRMAKCSILSDSAALLRLLDCCHLLPVMLATGLLFAAAWASAAAAPPSPPATLPNYHGCASPIALSHQCVPASDSPKPSVSQSSPCASWQRAYGEPWLSATVALCLIHDLPGTATLA